MLSGVNRQGVITDLALGLQSVVYYVVACQPCRKVAYRRQRARQAAIERQEKTEFELEQPQLFPHPSPFSTNLYWQEEINLGPGPPPQRAGTSRKGSQRRLNHSGAGSSMDSSRAPSSRGYISPVGMQTPIELLTDTEENTTCDNWNRRRYHRADEPLWGREIYRDTKDEGGAGPGDRGLSGSSVGFPGVRKPDVAQPYYVLRNPPVNDYHPPIVSTPPLHKSETYWMLQPPPSAKIMEGKVPARSTRSDSGEGSQHGGLVSLGRRVGERLLEEKVRKGERPPMAPSERPGTGEKRRLDTESQSSSVGSDGQREYKPPSPSSPLGRKQRRRPPPIEISEDSRSSEDLAIHIPIDTGDAPSKPPKKKLESNPTSILTSSSLSPTSPTHHKRHSDPTPSDRFSPPLFLLNTSSSTLTISNLTFHPLNSKSTLKPVDSSYNPIPEITLSTSSPKRDTTSQVLQEIVSPNYTVASSRSSSPLLTEPRIPPPAPTQETLFRDFRFPDFALEGVYKGPRRSGDGNSSLKSRQSTMGRSKDGSPARIEVAL